MARYTVKIDLPGSGKEHYQLLTSGLKSTIGNSISVLPANTSINNRHYAGAAYFLDGDISIQDLGSLLSRVAAPLTRGYSFTIVRNKTGSHS